MGSASFMERSSTVDVARAFCELQSEAGREHGFGSYQGTIAQSPGFDVRSCVPVAAAAAVRFAQSRLDDMSKWEPCEVIAVGKAAKVGKKVVAFDMDVARVVADSGGRVEVAHVAAAAGVAVERVAGFRVVASSPKYKTSVRRAGPSRKFWTTRSNGGEFASKALALAYAREVVERPGYGSSEFVSAGSSVEVFQRTACSPEAAVERRLVSWKVKVEVEVVSGPLEFDHWLFYGMAPC